MAIEKTGSRILPHDLQQEDYGRTVYTARIDHGVKIDDIEKNEYWAHVSNKLRRFDKIAAVAEDGTYYAELLVIATGTGYAQVKTLFYVDLAEVEEVEDQSLCIVKWRSPTLKWGIIRLSDNLSVKDGFETRDAADTYRKQYESTITRQAA